VVFQGTVTLPTQELQVIPPMAYMARHCQNIVCAVASSGRLVVGLHPIFSSVASKPVSSNGTDEFVDTVLAFKDNRTTVRE